MRNKELRRLLRQEEKMEYAKENYESQRNLSKLEERLEDIQINYSANDAANDRIYMNSEKWFSYDKNNLEKAGIDVLWLWLQSGGLFIFLWWYLL